MIFKNFYLFSVMQMNYRIFSDVLEGDTIQQGILTEGEGSVQLTSSLRGLVL